MRNRNSEKLVSHDLVVKHGAQLAGMLMESIPEVGGLLDHGTWLGSTSLGLITLVVCLGMIIQLRRWYYRCTLKGRTGDNPEPAR